MPGGMDLPGGPAPPMPDREITQMQSAPMRNPEAEAAAAAEAEGGGKRVRPKSARRPPPRVTSNEVKVEKAAPVKDAPPVSGVILEGMAGAEDDNVSCRPSPFEPMPSLRPSSPSSPACPHAPMPP